MIKPMKNRILVKEIIPEEQTMGLLILPESAQNRALVRAEIIRVGDGVSFTPGTVVLYVEYSAAKVEDSGVEYSLVRDEDIIGIIE